MVSCFKCGKLIPGKYEPGEYVMCNECLKEWHKAGDCQHDVIFPKEYVYEMIDRAPTVTKPEQEAAPVMVPHNWGTAWNCGYCGTEIDVIRDTGSADTIPKMYRYCRMCGVRIKWG